MRRRGCARVGSCAKGSMSKTLYNTLGFFDGARKAPISTLCAFMKNPHSLKNPIRNCHEGRNCIVLPLGCSTEKAEPKAQVSRHIAALHANSQIRRVRGFEMATHRPMFQLSHGAPAHDGPQGNIISVSSQRKAFRALVGVSIYPTVAGANCCVVRQPPLSQSKKGNQGSQKSIVFADIVVFRS